MFNSQTTGYIPTNEQYKQLQHNKASKNNVTDFAKMSEFESEKLALSADHVAWPKQSASDMMHACYAVYVPKPAHTSKSERA